jgi:AcrR family transcriptional regulator
VQQVDHRKGPRRRGDVLEEAILRAAIDELAEVGYPSLSMERVAARARTSKAALYRRWPNRAELVVDAYSRYVVTDLSVEDTGNLRDDVLELLRLIVRRMTSPMAQTLHGLLADARDDRELIRVIREHLLMIRPVLMTEILDRAAARGELRAWPLSPRLVTLPLDLLRSECLVPGPPILETALIEIVDDVFLPLVRA